MISDTYLTHGFGNCGDYQAIILEFRSSFVSSRQSIVFLVLTLTFWSGPDWTSATSPDVQTIHIDSKGFPYSLLFTPCPSNPAVGKVSTQVSVLSGFHFRTL
jgi:hypothetical protein